VSAVPASVGMPATLIPAEQNVYPRLVKATEEKVKDVVPGGFMVTTPEERFGLINRATAWERPFSRSRKSQRV
jgi:hypothetical protein